MSAIILGVLLGGSYFLFAQQIKKEDCFFLSSLNYTVERMQYWYAKENGGFESVSGVPYDDLVYKGRVLNLIFEIL